MDPLDMMNSDCWEEVIEFLSGKDKHSLSATCRAFEDLLQAKRLEWMFDAILPCISDWLYVPDRFTLQILQFNPRRYKKRTPNWKNLRSCRLVCKSWCYSVDNFVANWHKDEEDWRFEYEMMYPVLPQTHHYCFYEEDDWQWFAEEFPNSARNPFFGRYAWFSNEYVTVNPNAGEDHNENQDEMQMVRAVAVPSPYNVGNGPFLELYGKHIWKVTLTTPVYQRLRVNFFQNFQEWLSFFPNLKTLKIRLLDQNPTLTDIRTFTFTEWSEEDYSTQAELVNQFPLPELPHLERIQYYGRNRNYKSVQLLLAKYCGALKHLEWNAKLPDLSHFARMKCLNSLHLFYNMNRETDRIIEEVLRALQCPLEYLSLGVFMPYYNREEEPGKEDWHMDRFLQSIQHLPVLDLKLHLGNHNILCCENETHPLPDTYPENTTIKTLLIRCYDNIRRASFNFLPQLKSLESFTFYHCRFHLYNTLFTFNPLALPLPLSITDLPNVPKVLELEYCSSKENVHLMKIWDKIPSLKMFTYVKGDLRSRLREIDLAFSRDEYDKLVLEKTLPPE